MIEENYKIGYRLMIDREINAYMDKYFEANKKEAYVTRDSLERLRVSLKMGI